MTEKYVTLEELIRVFHKEYNLTYESIATIAIILSEKEKGDFLANDVQGGSLEIHIKRIFNDELYKYQAIIERKE